MKQKILFTGSSSGIGRWLTQHLVQEGHSVWGIARSDQSRLCEETRTSPGEFRFSLCDVSSWQSLSQLAKEVESTWGQLDSVICASGVQGAMGAAMNLDPLEWQNTVHSNLNGTYFSIRAFYPLLLKTRQECSQAHEHGKIICFSGGGATSSRPNFSAYAAAKTGLVRLVEVLAEEWKQQPIDINSLAPGAIYTRMTEEVIALGPSIVGQKEYNRALQIKSTGGDSLDKVYGLVQFLLSAKSNGITGRLLSAQWDAWGNLAEKAQELSDSEIFTLRRVLPK